MRVVVVVRMTHLRTHIGTHRVVIMTHFRTRIGTHRVVIVRITHSRTRIGRYRVVIMTHFRTRIGTHIGTLDAEALKTSDALRNTRRNTLTNT